MGPFHRPLKRSWENQEVPLTRGRPAGTSWAPQAPLEVQAAVPPCGDIITPCDPPTVLTVLHTVLLTVLHDMLYSPFTSQHHQHTSRRSNPRSGWTHIVVFQGQEVSLSLPCLPSSAWTDVSHQDELAQLS